MELRFYIDPETTLPHIHNHGVTEEEVRQVWARGGQDYAGTNNTRMRLGQTEAGRYLQIIYAPDEDGQSALVITSYPLTGKALQAFRRRKRRRRQ